MFMTPKIIDGKAIAAKVEESCKSAIESFGLTPKLVVITTDEADPASKVYMRNKQKAAARIGIQYEEIILNKYADQTIMLSTIRRLNADPAVHGIIVQLPLPARFDPLEIQETIDPSKDVDGFHSQSSFDPCTPDAVIHMLHDEGFELDGRHAVVIGRSNIVGKPLARLLLQENATVSVCHSHTDSILLEQLCKNADFVFCAAGVPGLVRPEMLAYGTVLVDISINRDIEGKLCGDVHPDCYPLCSAYTPVPGGVGPLTVSRLMWHTVESAMRTHVEKVIDGVPSYLQ